MKNNAILAASFAMAALVGAVPLNIKRDIVYTTTTEEVWETYWSTTTLWVDPAVAAVAPTSSPAGGFYEVKSSTTSSSTSTTSASSYSAPPVAVAPASVVPAPSSTLTSVYVAPSTYVEPTPTPPPTSTYVAPAPAPTSSSAAAAAAAPAPVAASSSGTTGTNSGDLTYYDVSVGLGSCGVPGTNSQDLVAINAADMANGVNPNANPHCGKQINIYYNGNMHTATVFDTCPDCAKGSIDVTNSLFLKVAPNGDGRVHGVSWSWA